MGIVKGNTNKNP